MRSTLIASALAGSESAPTRAQLAPIALASPSATPWPALSAISLRLEVFINGQPTHLVEPFELAPDHHLFARQTALEEVGVKVSGSPHGHSQVDLASLPGVVYAYDEPHQRIDFKLTDNARSARVYDARGERIPALPPRADWGTILNYSAYGTTSGQLGALPHFSGASLSLDARAFGPLGAIGQTAIVGNTIGTNADTLRLDTTYAYSDPNLMLTGRAGDTISGGLTWTRPIRLGGVQLQRDFTLRGDLVTQPMPNLTGSAAVPSTVDVFVNGLKTYSQDVGTGPYNITNLPVVSGNGTANVVVTDVTGRQTQTSLPFFSTPNLLAKGLTDFSLEAGFARRNYGLSSEDYDKDPLGSATLRRGLTDWLTVETHGEGGAGLVNGGIGAITRLGRFGSASLAFAGSHAADATGAQIYADYNFEYAGITLDVSTQRTFRSYDDLAAVTATTALTTTLAAAAIPGSYALDFKPPRALDRVTLGIPLKSAATSLSASLINLVQADGSRSRIVTVSLSRPLPFNASLYVTGFYDLTHRSGSGVFAGISVPLGPTITANVGGSYGGDGRYGTIDVSKQLDQSNNSFGWRFRDVEGSGASRAGELDYRSTYGTADLQITQQARELGMRGELDGSIGMLTTGGFFAGNSVQNSFALVSTGLPNVPVYEDNRLIGTTDPFGKLVVAQLNSYQHNTIGIDPLGLPANADARTTKTPISVASHAGVGLDFGIDRKVDAALVKFVNGAGKPLPVGLHGHLGGDQEGFVVGYDGQAYLKHLSANNRATIDLGDHDCAASFTYASQGGKRVTIGPIACQ